MRTQGQPLLQSGHILLLHRIFLICIANGCLSLLKTKPRQNSSYRHHLFCQCSTHTLLLTLKKHCTCYDSFKPPRIFFKKYILYKVFKNRKEGFALNFGCKPSLVLLSASFHYKFFLFVILSFVFPLTSPALGFQYWNLRFLESLNISFFQRNSKMK